MSAPEHSPLPWRVSALDGLIVDDNGLPVSLQKIDHERLTIIDAKGDIVYIDSADAEEIANSRFIVTAVNSHAALIAAAKRMLATATMCWPHCPEDIAGALQTAIAKAEDSP